MTEAIDVRTDRLARINALVDLDSFVEFGSQARHRVTAFGMERKRPAGDGVVTGSARVHGRGSGAAPGAGGARATLGAGCPPAPNADTPRRRERGRVARTPPLAGTRARTGTRAPAEGPAFAARIPGRRGRPRPVTPHHRQRHTAPIGVGRVPAAR